MHRAPGVGLGALAGAVDDCENGAGEIAVGVGIVACAEAGLGVLVGVGCETRAGCPEGTGDALAGPVADGEGPGRTVCAEATRPIGWPARCDAASPSAKTATVNSTETSLM